MLRTGSLWDCIVDPLFKRRLWSADYSGATGDAAPPMPNLRLEETLRASYIRHFLVSNSLTP